MATGSLAEGVDSALALGSQFGIADSVWVENLHNPTRAETWGPQIIGSGIGAAAAIVAAIIVLGRQIRHEKTARTIQAVNLYMGICAEMKRILDRTWYIIDGGRTGNLSNAPILMDAKESSLSVMISLMPDDWLPQPVLAFYENAGFIAFHQNHALGIPSAELILGDDTVLDPERLRELAATPAHGRPRMLEPTDVVRQMATDQLRRYAGQVQALGFARDKFEDMNDTYEKTYRYLQKWVARLRKVEALADVMRDLQPISDELKNERIAEAKNPSSLSERIRRIVEEQDAQKPADSGKEGS